MADFAEAQNKINKVIWGLWQSDGVMFGALSMLDKIPDPRQDTMGLDLSSRTPTLRYNPNFVNKISQERLELVLVIEGFRTLLRHATTRLKDPAQISALSSSLAINQLMNDDLEKLLQGIDEVTPAPERFGLESNQAFEEYYRGLMDKLAKTNAMIAQIWGSMNQEEKQEMMQNAFDKYQQMMDERDQNADEDGYQQYDDEGKALKDYMDPNGTGNDGWSKNDLFDASVKNFVNKMKRRTDQWGKYTGKAKATISAALEPKISAKDILRKFSCSVLTGKTETSRMKVNRRWDIERPGYRRIYKPKVIFAIDSSGSMDDEDLAYGFAVVNRTLFYAEIIFVEFDTEIKIIEKSFKKAKKEFAVHGRGGTDFEQIMDLADELDVDGTIVYTDGCAGPPHQPRGKVLWLLHAKGAKPPVGWGMRAHLDRFEDGRIW